MNSRFIFRGLPYFACLLACATINLFYFPPTLFFFDEQRFLASAIKFVATGEFSVGSDRAWEMPGTALFFAPAAWLFGPNAAIVPIRMAQAILVVVQCGLISVIARRIFGKAVPAFIASCIAAPYPFFLFYQGLLFSETLFDTLLLAGVAALYWWRERGMRIDIALVVASLCLSSATLTKATLRILPPLLIAAIAWIAGANLHRTIAILLATACLYGAFMSPWWIRNTTLLGTLAPFTTGSAHNLYLGKNPGNPDAGIDWATNVEPDVVARINALPNEMDRQRAYSQAAVDYITKNPATFFRAFAK